MRAVSPLVAQHADRAMSLDAGSLHAVLRLLHIGGGLLAFAVAPLALLATKGSRRHILAGRCFTLGMAAAAVPGLLLALHPGVPPGLHLTSMLAAYVVAWDFVWAQFIPVLPSYAEELTWRPSAPRPSCRPVDASPTHEPGRCLRGFDRRSRAGAGHGLS